MMVCHEVSGCQADVREDSQQPLEFPFLNLSAQWPMDKQTGFQQEHLECPSVASNVYSMSFQQDLSTKLPTLPL